MIALSLQEICEITSGQLATATTGALRVTGAVVTDSREAEPGSLYVARVGEHADGHDYIDAAAERGAVATLSTRAVANVPAVVVPDTELAFGALARGVIERAPGLEVVGVTGSSGKTTTKDLLGQVLRGAGPTIAPLGSYNSEIGVPLTVTRIDQQTKFLVVEFGARGVGHIRYLTSIAPPRIGVVLNVGSAHVGEFGSVQAIADAKAELVQALPRAEHGGVAILNGDDPRVRAMADLTQARVVLTSAKGPADVRADAIRLDDRGRPRFQVHTVAGQAQIELTVVGTHQVSNALAVIATGIELGLSVEFIAGALSTAEPKSRWRMEVHERDDGVTIVNDAYNANPESMRAAIDALVTLSGTAGRSWAVLGAMLELGESSESAHRGVGAAVDRAGITELLVVGENARAIVDGVSAGSATRVRWVADDVAAEEVLGQELRADDVVLFKSSRDAGLRWLGDRLTQAQEGSA